MGVKRFFCFLWTAYGVWSLDHELVIVFQTLYLNGSPKNENSQMYSPFRFSKQNFCVISRRHAGTRSTKTEDVDQHLSGSWKEKRPLKIVHVTGAQ